MNKGIFITFEGPDAVGKSTQIKLFENYLRKNNHKILMTREPGGTLIGEYVRKFFKTENEKSLPITNAMLFAACRNELINKVIIPHLEQGYIVICDRYIDSSYAYQLCEGVSVDDLDKINDFALKQLVPDMTFLLDMDIDKIIARIKSRKEGKDQFEKVDVSYIKSLQEHYHHIAKRDQGRVKLINADATRDDVAENIKSLFDDFIKRA